jgi:hypothetical protein
MQEDDIRAGEVEPPAAALEYERAVVQEELQVQRPDQAARPARARRARLQRDDVFGERRIRTVDLVEQQASYLMT